MKSFTWWLGQKPRVRKKYTLLLGGYLSPKEAKQWLKDRQKAKKRLAERKKNEGNGKEKNDVGFRL